MRYFTLSIILYLSSFNSYGVEKEKDQFPFIRLPEGVPELIIAKAVLDDPQTVFELSQVTRNIRNIIKVEVEKNPSLKERRDLYNWIKSAIKAGEEGIEPDHLLEVLEVEKRLFAEFLKHKESTRGNDPVEWKKHALASLLSYSATLIHTRNAANNASEGAFRNTAKDAAKDAARNIIYYAAKDAAKDAARNIAYYAAESAAYHTAYHAAYNDIKNFFDNNDIGHVAYRIAETKAWITALGPSLNTFEKAYDAAYSELTSGSEEDLGPWFRSQEIFESKLNKYFVHHKELNRRSKGLNDRSKKFLQHLVNHLNRMIPKMFPTDRIEA